MNSSTNGLRNALILVDIQNDFLPGGALAVPYGDEVLSVANRLQNLFDVVIATRDWHPADHGSFAANHPNTEPGDVVRLGGSNQVLWPEHCVQHTTGAELASGLDPLPRRQEVFKGLAPEIDSYSGFFDNGHLRKTELDDRLRRQGVQRLFIMGLATDYCVKFTALDAIQLGYETYVIADGCRGVELQPGDIENAKQELMDAGVKLIDSHQVADLLDTGEAGDVALAPSGGLGIHDEVLAETKHLRFIRRGDWDFVSRSIGTGVVAIVAVTSNDELVLIEQYRPPLAGNVIELPAGIVGDLQDAVEESFETAAQRELVEETGFQAATLRCVLTTAASGGLTDEQITFVMASGLEKVNEGGGDASESITVHLVPLSEIDNWLRDRASERHLIDARVAAGVYLIRANW